MILAQRIKATINSEITRDEANILWYFFIKMEMAHILTIKVNSNYKDLECNSTMKYWSHIYNALGLISVYRET